MQSLIDGVARNRSRYQIIRTSFAGSGYELPKIKIKK